MKTKEKGTFYKKIDNFWYYYKYHTLLALFITAVSVYSFITALHTAKPDYRILLSCKQVQSTTWEGVLEEELKKYGKDLNGDGKVVIEVTNCTADEEKESYLSSSLPAIELLTELEKDDILIYVTDEAKFTYISDYFNGQKDAQKNAFLPVSEDKKNPYKVSWQGTKLQKSSQSGFKNLSFSIRNPKGTDMEKDKDIENQIKEIKEFIERIKTGRQAGG